MCLRIPPVLKYLEYRTFCQVSISYQSKIMRGNDCAGEEIIGAFYFVEYANYELRISGFPITFSFRLNLITYGKQTCVLSRIDFLVFFLSFILPFVLSCQLLTSAGFSFFVNHNTAYTFDDGEEPHILCCRDSICPIIGEFVIQIAASPISQQFD